LGSSEGKAFLAGNSLYGFVKKDEGIPIDITTIDGWSARTNTHIDFLKGDLESYEFEVLKGARDYHPERTAKDRVHGLPSWNNWREDGWFAVGARAAIQVPG